MSTETSTEKRMTSDELREFMANMNWTQMETAKRLGVSRPSVRRWSNSKGGAPVHIRLACAYLAANEKPKPKRERKRKGNGDAS